MLWATFWRTVYTGKLANDMWYVTETLITYLSLFSRTRKDKLLYKDSARPEYVTETLITYLSVFYRTRKDTLLYKDSACHDWKHTYSHPPSTRLDSIWGPMGGGITGHPNVHPYCLTDSDQICKFGPIKQLGRGKLPISLTQSSTKMFGPQRLNVFVAWRYA